MYKIIHCITVVKNATKLSKNYKQACFNRTRRHFRPYLCVLNHVNTLKRNRYVRLVDTIVDDVHQPTDIRVIRLKKKLSSSFLSLIGIK